MASIRAAASRGLPGLLHQASIGSAWLSTSRWPPLAGPDVNHRFCEQRSQITIQAAGFPLLLAQLSSLAGEGDLSASAGVQDQLSVDLLTAERDADCGPLTDERERTGRRERPDPVSLMPTSRIRESG